MNRKNTPLYGFTLVELIIVISVIGIIASISIVTFRGSQERARDASVISDVDNMEASQTNYGLKNNEAGIEYYSADGADAELGFTPSKGNVIDVVVDDNDYCIRGYNPRGNKKSLATAAIKESSSGACARLSPSATAVAADTAG